MRTEHHYTPRQDEINYQSTLSTQVSDMRGRLASMRDSERAWVVGQLAMSFCFLCGKERSRTADGKLLACQHGN